MFGTENKGGLNLAVFGCALYIFVSIARLPELFPTLAKLSLGNVSIILIALGLLISRDKMTIPVFKTTIGKLLLAFILLSIISIYYSVWRTHSLEYMFDMILKIAILFYVIAKTATSLYIIKFYLNCLILSAGLLSYLSIQQTWVGRLTVSEFYDPNDLALILVSILPLSMIGIYVSKLKGKILYGSIVLMNLIAIMLTGSRGGFIGLIVIFAYLIFTKLPVTHHSTNRKILFSKITIFVILFGIIITFENHEMWQRYTTILNIQEDYNITEQTGRLEIWKRGINIFLSRPYGVGIGASDIADGMHGGRYQTAHNSLLQVAIELGIVGLFIFLGFYRVAFKKLSVINKYILNEEIRNRYASQSLRNIKLGVFSFRGSLIGFFVTSMFLSQAYNSLFYVFLAIITSSVYLLEKSKTDCNQNI